jgi:hypothetical protein
MKVSLGRAIALVLVLVPVLARGQTLTIPALTPALPNILPIAGVRMTLELTAAPTSLSVTVGSTTTAVPMDSGWHNIGPAGPRRDQVKATSATVAGTPVLYVLVNPRNMLSGGSDGGAPSACGLDAGVTDRAYDWTIGGATVTAYRLTSYSANSTDACGCTNRRVDINSAFLSNVGTAVNRGRHPEDVIFVLDKSGSMSSPTPGDPLMVSKWNALVWGFKQVVTFWEVEGFGTQMTGGTQLATDRLGVVFFDTNPDPLASIPLIERGSSGVSPHPWEAIKSAIDSRMAGGSTALGGGVANAFLKARQSHRCEVSGTVCTTDADCSGDTCQPTDTTIVLMTDGIQNQAPEVQLISGDASLAIGADPVVALKTLCTPILAVGIGDSQTVEAELLDKIMGQTAGPHADTQARIIQASSTDTGFVDSMVQALKGNTMSTALQKEADATTAGTSYTVNIDGTVKFAIFRLAWLSGAGASLQIKRPDGTVVEPRAVGGPGYFIARVDLPDQGPPGAWTVNVLGRVDVNVAARTTTTMSHYRLGAYLEESQVAFNLSMPGKIHPAGQPLVVNALVGVSGVPQNQITGNLAVQVERPKTALGTLLHNTKATGQPPVLDPDQLSSPYETKLETLLQDSNFVAQIGTRAGEGLTFTTPGNGKYSLSLSDTKTPGTYRFQVAIDLKTPMGNIHREETIETRVEVLSAPSNTDVTVNFDRASGQYLAVMLPRDALGNFKGPGYDNQVGVKVDGKPFAATVNDALADGTYSIALPGIPENANPQVSISIAGAEVRNDTLQNLVKGRKPCGTGVCCGGGMGNCVPIGAAMLALFSFRRRKLRA